MMLEFDDEFGFNSGLELILTVFQKERNSGLEQPILSPV
jgi:hypothetical protein